MNGRAGLRATAERIRRDYGPLLGHEEPARDRPIDRLRLMEQLEAARARTHRRRHESQQLELDLRQR